MKLGFIGTGVMSGAIARGVQAGDLQGVEIFLYDRDEAKALELAQAVQGTVCKDASELSQAADLVVLGVKPAVQTSVLEEIAPALTGANQPTLVSIAAGRSLHAIVTDLSAAPEVPPIVRVMPNVAASVGQAMSALTATEGTDQSRIDAAKAVFGSVGKVMELPEDLFSVFTAMAGSSPAWMFYIVQALARAGVAEGMTAELATEAATQAMLGSALLLEEGRARGVHASELIDGVCSPGGTTIAGLLAAEEAGLASALHGAVAATVSRDIELGEQ